MSHRASLAVTLREVAALPTFTDRSKIPEHDDEKPAEPHTFPAPLIPNAVHPIVPVTGADERESMRPVFHGVRYGTHGVLEQRRPFRRLRR